VNLVKRAWNIC